MYTIRCLNKISVGGLDNLSKKLFAIQDDAAAPDGIIVRSADMHSLEFPSNLLAIGRAGAGVNNIPVDACSEKGIVVFNTPGANANAVKELVIGALVLSSRKITEGVSWAKTLKGKGDEVASLVEKGKKAFVGPEISGKTLGVIGLGAIGGLVANAALALDMDVLGYDPYISVDAAWRLSTSIAHAKSLDEIFEGSDYITIHLPQTPDTKGMINKEAIAKMKDGVRIINCSRGGLVNNADMLEALASGKVASYVTDFPDESMLCVDNVVAIPHLGASTPESEENCAAMAAKELSDYLQNGNIKNAVNLPNVEMPWGGKGRLCIINKNIPAILGSITNILAANNININDMVNRSKGDYAYTLIGVDSDISAAIEAEIAGLDGVIRVRVITK